VADALCSCGRTHAKSERQGRGINPSADRCMIAIVDGRYVLDDTASHFSDPTRKDT
jgi:hypothetical protein